MSAGQGTVWLARVTVDPTSRQARGDLRDASSMHRRMMMFCGRDDIGPGARAEIGLLYRVDRDRTGTHILVQFRAPSLAFRLPPGYGRVDVRDLSPLLAGLHAGQQVRYRITANPSERRGSRDGDDVDFFAAGSPPAQKRRRGPVVGLAGVDADRWWHLHAERDCGLTLVSAAATPLGAAVGRDGDTRIRHVLVRFDGVATVRDPDALRGAVLAGVGRAKPYGAGLLSLAPPPGAAPG